MRRSLKRSSREMRGVVKELLLAQTSLAAAELAGDAGLGARSAGRRATAVAGRAVHFSMDRPPKPPCPCGGWCTGEKTVKDWCVRCGERLESSWKRDSDGTTCMRCDREMGWVTHPIVPVYSSVSEEKCCALRTERAQELARLLKTRAPQGCGDRGMNMFMDRRPACPQMDADEKVHLSRLLAIYEKDYPLPDTWKIYDPMTGELSLWHKYQYYRGVDSIEGLY